MANPANKKQYEFDVGKLAKMLPPFQARVERLDPKTQQFEPIALPQELWGMDEIQRLEQIVLNDVSGGGSYKAQISDSRGESMAWKFVYSTDIFPSKVPPGAAGALGPASAGLPVGGVQPRVVSMPSSGWTPGMYGSPVAMPTPPQPMAYGQQAQMMQQQMYPQAFSPYGAPPWWGYQAPPASPRNGGNGASDPQVEMLRQQLQAMTQQAAEERHLREREQAEARHRQELAETRQALQQQAAQQAQEMRELKESLERRPRGDDDPAVAALKLQVEQMRIQSEQAQRDRDRLEAENHRREAEARHREELRTMQDNSQRELAALRELIAEGNRKAVDPTMQMLFEVQRQQAEAQRESNRLASESAKEAARMASDQPRVVMEMIERAKSASGADQVLANVARAYEGVMGVQNKVMEAMMSQNGTSPAVELAASALNAGKETLDAYIKSKRDQALSDSRTEQYRQQVAFAQASAVQAQVQAQDPYRYADGSIKGQSPERTQLGGSPGVTDAEIVETAPANANGANGKPKESEIFGPIYEEILAAREAVAKGEATPEDVAAGVVQAAGEIVKQGITIPVFSLYAEKRYGDLMEFVLPAADIEFRAACVKEIDRLRSEVEV